MRALTLTQPWATLVAIGAKKIETRSWRTDYRGRLAIHAAKSFPNDCMEMCQEEPFRGVLAAAGIAGICDLPRGSILCLTEITDCLRTEHIAEAPCLYSECIHELEFGDYYPGRFGFLFGAVKLLPAPVPCRGALGLWEIPSILILGGESDLDRKGERG